MKTTKSKCTQRSILSTEDHKLNIIMKERSNNYMKQETETTTKSKSTQWSDLPVEISEQIMSRLYFKDQVRFRAVCKMWQSITQYKKRPADSLPWLITLPSISKNIFECQAYEPLSSDLNPYTVDEIILYKNVTCSAAARRDIGVTYNCGCILFSISRTDTTTTNFLLFDILTKKVTTLPNLYHSKGYNHSFIQAFSADPNTRDYVFLVLQFTSKFSFTISTLRSGEKNWTTNEFCGRPFSSVGSTVYIRGIFYFVSHLGEVKSYKIATGVWRTVCYGDGGVQVPLHMTKEVFQLDGDLVLVCYDTYYNDSDTGLCRIRKFDLSQEVWVRVKSLRDRALFVSQNSFSVSTVGDEARNNGVLANQIYCLTSWRCIVYTLENGKMVKFRNSSGIKSWDTSERYKKFWLEPPDHQLKHKQPR